MNVVSLGTDLIECERVADVLGRHEQRFLDRVLTPAEVQEHYDAAAIPPPPPGIERSTPVTAPGDRLARPNVRVGGMSGSFHRLSMQRHEVF